MGGYIEVEFGISEPGICRACGADGPLVVETKRQTPDGFLTTTGHCCAECACNLIREATNGQACA